MHQPISVQDPENQLHPPNLHQFTARLFPVVKGVPFVQK